jgi:transcription termination factor Rho
MSENNNITERDEPTGRVENGIIEVLPDGFGFIRMNNYLPDKEDIYVSQTQIRRFNLKTGDAITGDIRDAKLNERFKALMRIDEIDGLDPSIAKYRNSFESLTPIFPNERIHLNNSVSTRIIDLLSPIGKGQRGVIVSPPKAGKTTLLKDIALSVQQSNPEIHLMILLIDERPEEVTDIKETVKGDNVEVIYSTFDESPERHKKVAEMVIERAKCLVECDKDVMILLDSITRLSRAYNLTTTPSGRTLSGGLDPNALYMPKRFFGAARNTRESGSLTILATALVETGSKIDDVIFEEFKGTGNMEVVLSRKLQERRIFPAIDLQKSGTRRDDLLLTDEEQETVRKIRNVLNGMKSDQAVDQLLNLFKKTTTNKELIKQILKNNS